MNVNTARIRFTAIVSNLSPESQMDDSSTGTVLTFWRNRDGFYFVARMNDTMAKFGFTTRHESVESVVNAALKLAGF